MDVVLVGTAGLLSPFCAVSSGECGVSPDCGIAACYVTMISERFGGPPSRRVSFICAVGEALALWVSCICDVAESLVPWVAFICAS
eukprot:scaffold72513_cov20-Tisochrysis_lutea.AAC.1